jgi:hypothetical protein
MENQVTPPRTKKIGADNTPINNLFNDDSLDLDFNEIYQLIDNKKELKEGK